MTPERMETAFNIMKTTLAVVGTIPLACLIFWAAYGNLKYSPYGRFMDMCIASSSGDVGDAIIECRKKFKAYWKLEATPLVPN